MALTQTRRDAPESACAPISADNEGAAAAAHVRAGRPRAQRDPRGAPLFGCHTRTRTHKPRPHPPGFFRARAARSPAQVHGFVLWVLSALAWVLFIAWAYTPDRALAEGLGVTYFPAKHWALALPCHGFVTFLAVALGYSSLNCSSRPRPTRPSRSAARRPTRPRGARPRARARDAAAGARSRTRGRARIPRPTRRALAPRRRRRVGRGARYRRHGHRRGESRPLRPGGRRRRPMLRACRDSACARVPWSITSRDALLGVAHPRHLGDLGRAGRHGRARRGIDAAVTPAAATRSWSARALTSWPSDRRTSAAPDAGSSPT